MFAVPNADPRERTYEENLALIRQRVVAFVCRRLVPYEADFAAAEEIAQSCMVALWERYPEKRDLAEMMAIAIGITRNKIAQFRREQERRPELTPSEEPGHRPELAERIETRQTIDRFLRAMLQLNPRCRELLRLKLIEELDYSEIRLRTGIAGNIYEMTSRCHKALLRLFAGDLR